MKVNAEPKGSPDAGKALEHLLSFVQAGYATLIARNIRRDADAVEVEHQRRGRVEHAETSGADVGMREPYHLDLGGARR